MSCCIEKWVKKMKPMLDVNDSKSLNGNISLTSKICGTYTRVIYKLLNILKKKKAQVRASLYVGLQIHAKSLFELIVCDLLL